MNLFKEVFTVNVNSDHVLKIIYDAARNTPDNYVISVNIGIHGDERINVCDRLVNCGFISNVNYIGKDKIQCQVSSKTFDYFSNKGGL